MLSYAQFYMEKLGRHRWLKSADGKGIESSVPMLDVYRRMLSAWQRIGVSKVLSESEVSEIVNARNGIPGLGGDSFRRGFWSGTWRRRYLTRKPVTRK